MKTQTQHKASTIPQHWNKNSMSKSRCLSLLFFMCINIVVFSQTYPNEQSNASTYGNYTLPNSGIPNYLNWFNSDLSDSRVMRITDRNTFGVNGQRLRHNYSKDQTWNSDETLIKMAGYPAAILDAETYEFLFWSDIPSYGRWSNTQPYIIYGTDGNKFVQHNVLSNSRTTLKTFNFSSVDFGFGEGNQDNNDKYVGLIGSNGSNRTLLVYDIQLNYIVGTKDLGTTNNIDWFSVSQLGNYAVIMWKTDGNGNQQGVKSYDITLTNENHITDVTEHAALSIDAYGNEVLVSYGTEAQWDNQYSLFMARLDGGGTTNLFPYVNGRGIWGGHISARNINRSGWVYISEQCCPTNPVAAAEVFALKLDNIGTVERYGKHNSYPSGYLHETQVVPNRNGTKVIFASNWNDVNEINQQAAHDFVLEVNQQTLGITEVTFTPEQPTEVNYYNVLGQKVSKNTKGILIKEIIYNNRVEHKKVIYLNNEY